MSRKVKVPTKASVSTSDPIAPFLQQPVVEELLRFSKETFKGLWVDNLVFCNDEPLPINRAKWIVIYLLFYEFRNMSGELSKKSKNIWYNEIREIGLFNLFTIENSEHFQASMETMFTGQFQVVKDKLLELHHEWTTVVLNCAEQSFGSPNYTVISIEKKGGQKFPYDFELLIRDKDKPTDPERVVKIEFKFSNSGNSSVVELAEFAALNTESENGLHIFRGTSYLDFFWDQDYFTRMVQDINRVFPRSIDTSVFSKQDWKKTAKSVSKPKRGKTMAFHSTLRDDNITKLPSKKTLVNQSFAEFIRGYIERLSSDSRAGYFGEISEIFNSKQRNKYFCIFSDGGFHVDTIPELTITDVMQSPNKPHVFILICSGGLNIQCGMSWGNGGAGNQNPRMLFKLIQGEIVSAEEEEDDGDEEAEGGLAGGGGSDQDIYGEYSWFVTDEELAKGDEAGEAELLELIDITTNRSEDKYIINKDGMVLRSGTIYHAIIGQRIGGKKSTKKNRKRTKKGLKKNKTRKVKRGRRK